MIDSIGNISFIINRIIDFCKTITPPEIKESIEPLKGDDEKVRQYGIELVSLIKQLILNFMIEIQDLLNKMLKLLQELSEQQIYFIYLNY